MKENLELTWSVTIVFCCVLLPTGGCQRGEETQQAAPRSADDVEQGPEDDDGVSEMEEGAGDATISEERAVEIARETAEQEGYDLSIYELRSVEFNEEGNRYWVHFEHAPPTPPGGHFSVDVNATSEEARLVRGE